MNPELYERYLAKKAKKLGISVEELKKQGTSSPVKETATNTTEPTPTVQTMSTSAPSQTTISQSTVQTSSQYTQQYSQRNLQYFYKYSNQTSVFFLEQSPITLTQKIHPLTKQMFLLISFPKRLLHTHHQIILLFVLQEIHNIYPIFPV